MYMHSITYSISTMITQMHCCIMNTMVAYATQCSGRLAPTMFHIVMLQHDITHLAVSWEWHLKKLFSPAPRNGLWIDIINLMEDMITDRM